MKKLILVSTLVAAGLVSGLAGAAEQGRVISSTPVMRQVTEPGRATEDRLIGYKVVYEYAGKQHTVQLPFAPGPTIELDIQPVGVNAAPAPSTQVSAPQPLYSNHEVITSTPPVVYSQPPVVYSQPSTVYIEQPYYPPVRYYPSYYSYDPVWPALAVGVGLGYVFRGGCCWGRGWSGRGVSHGWHR